jgi:hypothetical protein
VKEPELFIANNEASFRICGASTQLSTAVALAVSCALWRTKWPLLCPGIFRVSKGKEREILDSSKIQEC